MTYTGVLLSALPHYIYRVSFPRNSSEPIDTLYDPYFHFCYELAVETSAKCSSIKPLKVHDLCYTHSLASLQWTGLSNQWTLLLTDNCLQCQKCMEPLQKQRSLFYAHLCWKGEKWPSQCRPRLFYLQSAKAAAMYTAPCAETHPPPPIPHFVLAQNLFSKRIAPIDNIWPLEIRGGWGLRSPWSSSSDVVIAFNYVETMW